MRYELCIRAYDVMDEVWITIQMKETNSLTTPIAEMVWSVSDQISGTGESDPLQWARDVLVALLEMT